MNCAMLQFSIYLSCEMEYHTTASFRELFNILKSDWIWPSFMINVSSTFFFPSVTFFCIWQLNFKSKRRLWEYMLKRQLKILTKAGVCQWVLAFRGVLFPLKDSQWTPIITTSNSHAGTLFYLCLWSYCVAGWIAFNSCCKI